MAIVCVCDLCGKPMSDYCAGHYVVKKRKRFSVPFESKWEYVDAHDACVEKLFRETKGQRGEV